jgi:hypothetical protein
MSAVAPPLSRRPQDVAFIAFWAINFGFITYMIDIEQLVIADPMHFTYPIWPRMRREDPFAAPSTHSH